VISPDRNECKQSNQADYTGQRSVAKLDELVKALDLVCLRNDRTGRTLWPRRAAQARAGEPHERPGDDDPALGEDVREQNAPQKA
jgi:hypothetical protein